MLDAIEFDFVTFFAILLAIAVPTKLVFQEWWLNPEAY
jgi:hypothetical protein